jgi:uncharacterized membrane protein YccF (DUF307 family)
MRLLLNVLWIFLGGGLLIWLEYLIGGLLLCLTVVGIPFGLQCFKIAGLALTPFGKDLVEQKGSGGIGFVLNVFWILIAGIWIFLSHLALGLGLAVTIIGIPFALQHLKLAFLALAPFGQRVKEG